MNAFLQFAIQPKPGALHRALTVLASDIPFEGSLKAVYLNRLGKRVSKRWSAFEAVRNWPVGSDEIMLTTDVVGCGALLEGRSRILTRVSPHDENWAPSEGTINDGLHVRGVKINRKSEERSADQWRPDSFPDFIEAAFGIGEKDDPTELLIALVRALTVADAGLLYAVADQVSADMTPCYRGYHWQQELLLVRSNLRRLNARANEVGLVMDGIHRTLAMTHGPDRAEKMQRMGYAPAGEIGGRFQIWRMAVQPDVIVTLPRAYDGRYAS